MWLKDRKEVKEYRLSGLDFVRKLWHGGWLAVLFTREGEEG